MSKVSLVLAACLLGFSLFASDGDSEMKAEMDSLRKVIDTLSEENYELHIALNMELAWTIRDVRPDSALYYANSALKLANEHGLIHQKIQATNYIGVAYRNLSNYSKAFEKYLEALNLAEDNGDREQMGYSLINLGNLYLFQTNFQGAIRYFIQALDQAQLLANRRMVAYCYLNLGRSYMGIEEFGQAELYFQQAIDIRKEQGDVYGQIAAEIDLANVYLKKGDLVQSRNYHEELLQRIDAEDNPRALCQVYANLARIYLNLNNTKKAEQSALKALEIARKVSSRFDEKNVLESLAEIYAGEANYEDAYLYHTRFSELNQQLFSEENIRKIEQLKNQYTIEKQEAENQFLRQQAELNVLMISRQRVIIVLTILGLLLLLLVIFISYRALQIRTKLNKEISKQRDQILSDKETIETQAAKLEELNEAKSRFFANVSHDLRTPLSLIYGNIEMLSEDEETILSQASKRNLDIGLKNCKRLLYLTDEINDLTKLEEGKIVLKKEVVKIGSYLRMLSEMFSGTAEYKGVKLEFENNLSGQDCISLDPRQFEKIFYNLVSNAIRHTDKGGKISIVLRKHVSKAIIEVRDSGEGISPESLPFIFDRFYQAKNSPHRSREGLGIGLALVKELVDLHEGEIEVESVVGEGTNFIMSFYLTEKYAAMVEEEKLFQQTKDRRHLYSELDGEIDAGVSLPKTETEKQTILIVDDHPEIRYHIRQILEDDYHIVEAAHGLEALEIIKINEVNLIVSDLMMPWMDGFEFLEALNANEDYKKIPVLVVSARISEEDQEKVLDKGVNDYIKKPFNKRELILRINNLLQSKENWEGSKDSFAQLFDKNGHESLEKEILGKLESLVMDRIDDVSLSVYDLADAMAASERQVYRLVKKMTGMTPYEYITEIRMKYADYLIRKNKVKNATEAAKSIGLKNVTTFNKQYEKKFGKKPAEVLNG
ncbi:response regulator [Marinoscillum sp. MHG1-6]|uniref:response regulator n=1 Tax=Marinoscillum sp. MHG1-6 TaxID=2959627 RepID=UPI0021584A3D|nr:response regulator [Marinoscillum sp. MHG1-6]